METQKRYVSDLEAAAFLGIAPQSLRNDRCGRRRIPYYKFGRSIRYDLAELDEFMRKLRHGGDAN
jgi:hypothetical protein